MKIMPCPLNGPRNITEFTYGGEVSAMPDPAACTDAEWANYVFNKSNPAGFVREWWLHNASSYWFIAERDAVTDIILRTYDPSEIFRTRVDFAAPRTTSSQENPA
ncbi:MAG: sarcosine oxidase subunit delta [Azoarcus sp.]|jgi:sarcosine oxidase subunit delta|nr:sarcosine oxidase subunit delta [Azoarcus sp.]